jgi:hypothetical protein
MAESRSRGIGVVWPAAPRRHLIPCLLLLAARLGPHERSAGRGRRPPRLSAYPIGYGITAGGAKSLHVAGGASWKKPGLASRQGSRGQGVGSPPAAGCSVSQSGEA